MISPGPSVTSGSWGMPRMSPTTRSWTLLSLPSNLLPNVCGRRSSWASACRPSWRVRPTRAAQAWHGGS
eukprot:5086937-Pyramimonas_sp.AAC.1